MKNAKRILSVLLVCLMLVSVFACSEKPAETDVTTPAAAVTTGNTPEDTTKSIYDDQGFILDKIPEDVDFKGQTINVLYWQDVENPEFFVEGLSGEAVNDGIFNRNAAVEERLKVKFNFIGVNGNWGNYDTYLTAVRNSINNGGSDVYDVLGTYSLTGGMLAYNGLVQDISTLDYIDLSAEWWPDTLLETAKIGNKLYFVSGDISTNLLYMMYAMYYNKNMVDDLKIDDPFTFVPDKKWTLDKMIELSNGVYADLDGNSKVSEGDRLGQACYNLHMDAFCQGSGIIFIKQNADGKLVLNDDFSSEKMALLTTKIYNYIHSADAAVMDTPKGDTYKTMFRDGLSLFITDRSDIAIYDLSEKQFTMGILPIPMYDENQDGYRTVTGNPFTLYLIPTNATNADVSACVLECMASEGYRKVTPMIFELSLKTRYADGGNNVQSYDILRGGVAYDLGRIFGRVFDVEGVTSPGTGYTNQIKSNSVGWSSMVKSYVKSINKVVDKLNAAFGG